MCTLCFCLIIAFSLMYAHVTSAAPASMLSHVIISAQRVSALLGIWRITQAIISLLTLQGWKKQYMHINLSLQNLAVRAAICKLVADKLQRPTKSNIVKIPSRNRCKKSQKVLKSFPFCVCLIPCRPIPQDFCSECAASCFMIPCCATSRYRGWSLPHSGTFCTAFLRLGALWLF